MSAVYKIIRESDYAKSFNQTNQFALDVLVGLSDPRKRIASRHMYDDLGSELFQKITVLPEYYVTGCEREVLSRNKEQIAEYVSGGPFNLVELGAGFSDKTALLLEYFLETGLDFRFVPIDISELAMTQLVDECNKRFPKLDTFGIVSDYFNGLKWLNNRFQTRNFVLFMGSSIGNFTAYEARVFLRNLWNTLNHGDFALIGFDLKKDIELLLDAYNDSQGVTAAFNLNVLTRINRELGGEFDIEKFRHFGTYDVFSGGMESYLVSLERQSVFIKAIGRSFGFAPWEPIHMEYSYKYLESDIDDLARETGFTRDENLYDSKRYFTDSIWRVLKPGPGSAESPEFEI